MATNTWTMVADVILNQSVIRDLTEFKGKIYGGTSLSGELFEWNGVDAWWSVADSGSTHIFSLGVYKNKLYAGDNVGNLFRWNEVDTLDVVYNIGVFWAIKSGFAELNGKLYFGDSRLGAGGRLWEWDGMVNPVIVAAQLNGQDEIHSIINYKGAIYGATFDGGRLFKWTGAAWIEVAGQYAANVFVDNLIEYEGRLFAGANKGGGLFYGLLLEWNGEDAWVKRADILNAQNIYSTVLHHENKLLAGTSDKANLFMWNGVDAWIQVAPQFGVEKMIFSLIEFNNKIYGGTATSALEGGKLLGWNPAYPGPPTELLVCDKASSGYGGACSPALISTLIPYFSAIYNDPDPFDIATHYRIQVNSASDMEGTMLFDSGKTAMNNVNEGERCEDITYAGLALTTGVTYYWRIMFWDDEGHIGDWSEVNCFKMVPPPPPIPPERENPVDAVGKVKKARLPLLSYERELIWSRLLAPPVRVILDP